jgi:hypothetical protein
MTREDRRVAPRVRVNLAARWEGVLGRLEGWVSDLSRSGCFILTAGEVLEGELIRVEIQLPTEGWIYLWGEVVNRAAEIGFGVRFTGSDERDQMLLTLFLDYALERASI